MKKSKKTKKEDVVEVSKVAFNRRQSGKSLTRAEVIKKVVGDDEVCVDGEDDVEREDRNPDTETDDEKLESVESLADTETVASSEEDAIQVFRDVMAMTDEDRNIDVDGKLAPVRLSPPPRPSWTDDPNNIKFKVGEFVRYKGYPNGNAYKVVGQGKENHTYSLKPSKSRDYFDESGDKLVRVADKNVDWIDYWKLNPVIPAPKPWLRNK